MFSLTIFKNQYDNKTDKRMDFQSWDQFEDLLYKLAKQPVASKKDAQLISPAVYEPGTTRANKNVTEWAGWAAVDVDDHQFEGDLESELHARYGRYYYVCYSTASSSIDHPKFRLIFPLTAPVRNGEGSESNIKRFWYALNTELGSIGDKQTKDLSRMYFIPASYDSAFNFIFTNVGQLVDPAELIKKHPSVQVDKAQSFFDRLPDEMKEKVMEHRKSKLMNTSYTWTSYRDCPFVSKKMILEYTSISQTGWYAKMYQLMCSVAVNAVRRQYPISAGEIAVLCREIDADNGKWYENRPMEVEANNAIEFAYRNAS